jgi:hypothetical protein
MSTTKPRSEAVTASPQPTEGKPLQLHRERVRRLGNGVRSGIKSGVPCSSHSVEWWHH